MQLLYIRGYCDIEGKDFWFKNAIIAKLPNIQNIKQSFWETYPKIIIPKDGKVIKIKNEKYIVKIKPKIESFVTDKHELPTVDEMVRQLIDIDVNVNIFFTLKTYEDFIRDKVNAFNMYHYNKFTFQPQQSDIGHFRLFPSILLADISKNLAHASILADRTDAMEIRNPPIRVSTYKNLPEFGKKRVVKNWVGLPSLEPTNEYNKKIAKPMFLNPTYISVEYSPYFVDENTQLKKLKEFFSGFANKYHLYKQDMKFIVEYIEHLIHEPERKRSKLDYLVNAVYHYTDRLFHPKIIRRIYGYYVLSRDLKVGNGLYIVRKNGECTNFIYNMVFESTEFWECETSNEGYFDIKKMFQYDLKNLYYYTSESDQNIRTKSPFLLLKMNQLIHLDHKPKVPPLKKVDIKDLGDYKLLKKIYFIKKRYYHSEYLLMNIRTRSQRLKGTVRPKGEKVIYIVKRSIKNLK